MSDVVQTALDARIAEAMKAIFDEIPARLNIQAILSAAYARLDQVVGADASRGRVIPEKLVEVLREIATVAVDEFTRRTGQPFLWIEDEPELEDDAPLMSFALDDKGNVTF